MVTFIKQRITTCVSLHTALYTWKKAIFFITVILGGSMPLQAEGGDYLEIKLPKTVYESYEPIVVNITLHMDPPFEWILDDPSAAIKQRRRLHRRISAILKREDETVASVYLTGGSFDIIQTPQHIVQVSVFGCVVNETERESISKSGDRRNEFIFFGEPGEYTILIKDSDFGMQSNEASLEIVPPKDEAAAIAFANGGVDSLLILMLTEHGEDAVETFKQIAESSPVSVYGAYAGMSLALREAEKPYWARTSGRITSEEAKQLATRLISQTKSFPVGHPLYNRAMLRAARYQFRTRGQSERAKQTLQHLIETSKDSGTISEATRILERTQKKVDP